MYCLEVIRKLNADACGISVEQLLREVDEAFNDQQPTETVCEPKHRAIEAPVLIAEMVSVGAN